MQKKATLIATLSICLFQAWTCSATVAELPADFYYTGLPALASMYNGQFVLQNQSNCYMINQGLVDSKYLATFKPIDVPVLRPAFSITFNFIVIYAFKEDRYGVITADIYYKKDINDSHTFDENTLDTLTMDDLRLEEGESIEIFQTKINEFVGTWTKVVTHGLARSDFVLNCESDREVVTLDGQLVEEQLFLFSCNRFLLPDYMYEATDYQNDPCCFQ